MIYYSISFWSSVWIECCHGSLETNLYLPKVERCFPYSVGTYNLVESRHAPTVFYNCCSFCLNGKDLTKGGKKKKTASLFEKKFKHKLSLFIILIKMCLTYS